MFLWRIWQVLRRQLVITVLGVVATAGASVGVFRVVPPSFAVTATVLLLPPSLPDARTSQPANPYLQLGGLSGPAEILSRALNDPSIQRELQAQGLGTDYEVARDFLTSAPVVLVTVRDPNLGRVRATRDWLLSRIPLVLTDLQAAVRVPPSAMMTSTVISDEGEVTTSNRTTLRVLLVVVAGVLLATLAVATVIDTLRRGTSGLRVSPEQAAGGQPPTLRRREVRGKIARPDPRPARTQREATSTHSPAAQTPVGSAPTVASERAAESVGETEVIHPDPLATPTGEPGLMPTPEPLDPAARRSLDRLAEPRQSNSEFG